MLEDVACEVAVWVDERESPARLDVLNDEVPKQRRLAASRAADRVEVLTPVDLRNAERRVVVRDALNPKVR